MLSRKEKIIADTLGGMSDALFAFGVMLAKAKLIPREEIGAAFTELAVEMAEAGYSEARMSIPRALALVFREPLAGELD